MCIRDRSSFIKHSKKIDDEYILFHYPTSTRPRNDIASITMDDWEFVDKLSEYHRMRVLVIADSTVDVPLSYYEVLIKPDIKYVVDLVANCDYYAGCDSFCSILAAKTLPKEKMFIKQSPNFTGWNNWLYRAFLPHSPEEVRQIYKQHIGT